MGLFLQIVGFLMMAGGVAFALSAKTAFHEIVAATSFGLGAAVVGIGTVATRLDAVLARLRPLPMRPGDQSAPARPAEKKDHEVTWKNRGNR